MTAQAYRTALKWLAGVIIVGVLLAIGGWALYILASGTGDFGRVELTVLWLGITIGVAGYLKYLGLIVVPIFVIFTWRRASAAGLAGVVSLGQASQLIAAVDILFLFVTGSLFSPAFWAIWFDGARMSLAWITFPSPAIPIMALVGLFAFQRLIMRPGNLEKSKKWSLNQRLMHGLMCVSAVIMIIAKLLTLPAAMPYLSSSLFGPRVFFKMYTYLQYVNASASFMFLVATVSLLYASKAKRQKEQFASDNLPLVAHTEK